jgi:ABC-type polysaccharide/polyol phosphate export permease
MKTFISSFSIHFRVVYALLMREVITRFGRHNIGVLWLIVEPMMFTLGVATLWKMVNIKHIDQISVIAFAVTGYSSVLIWRNAANRCVKAIEPNLALMHHRNVRIYDVFLSRSLLELAGGTASFIILALLFYSLGTMDLPKDLLKLTFGWLLLCWFGFALALLIGSLSERSEIVERVWHVSTYLLFPLSGAAYMVEWLPIEAQKALLWLPMVHGTEMIRHGYFGNLVPTHENPLYLITINLILTLLAFIAMRGIDERLRAG